jgi:MFS family permease
MEEIMNLKQEFKILKKFYIFYFLWGLASFLPAYWILYFQDIGFNFKEISIILSISMIAPIIFEVPTGAIADHFGRRISVFIGLFFAGIFVLLVPLTTKFLLLVALIFSFRSVATLISGSDSAWMVDYLKSKRKDKLISSAFARVASLVSVGAVIAVIGSSFIVKNLGMKYLWYVQGTLMIGTAIFAVLFGDKEKNIKKGNLKNAVKNTFGFAKQGFKLIFIQKTLFFFVLATFFSAFFNIGGIVWQPFFIDVGINLSDIGFVYAIAILMGVIAPNLSNKFVKLVGSEKWALIIEDIVIGVFFIFVSIVTSPIIAVLIFYTGAFSESIGRPIRNAFMHKRIPSKIRATTASISNFASSGGSIIALLLAGYIIDTFGLRMGFIFGGLAAIPVILSLLMIKNEK